MSQKCQNYNKFCAKCVACESRVISCLGRTPQQVKLGGNTPELENGIDIQEKLNYIEVHTGKSLFSGGEETGQSFAELANVAYESDKLTQVYDDIAQYNADCQKNLVDLGDDVAGRYYTEDE